MTTTTIAEMLMERVPGNKDHEFIWYDEDRSLYTGQAAWQKFCTDAKQRYTVLSGETDNCLLLFDDLSAVLFEENQLVSVLVP